MKLAKTWTTEEEYFAQKEIERRKKIVEEKLAQQKQEDLQKAKELHWMKCPKCGMDLQEIDLRGVMIDRCFHCGGLYLDDGELEKLTGENAGFVDKMVRLFKK